MESDRLFVLYPQKRGPEKERSRMDEVLRAALDGIDAEIVEDMELLEQGDETTAARKELLLRQGDEIRERIAGLERALARLEYKIEHYDEVMTAADRTLRAGE